MVNLWLTQSKDGFIVAIDTDRIRAGMDRENSEAMAPDEMYLLLQADMISIKQQEQVLQSEIEEIATKFHTLLESCGIDSDSCSGTMAPPSTPSFMKNTATTSLTHVTELETPTFMKTPAKFTILSDGSDDDDSYTLFPDSCPLVNKSDGLPLDSSVLSKTLIVDSNSNYLDSPHSEVDNGTPVIEAIPSLENKSPSTTDSSTSSSSSSHRMSSSDGYPKSDDSTDNQIVPECYDLNKEYMSRLKYYSDFTIDRERKIKNMVSQLGHVANDNAPVSVTEHILTRHVEGKESSPEKAPVIKPPVYSSATSGSGTDYQSTPTSRHRVRKERSHRNKQARTSRKSSSRPLMHSTMLEDSFSSSSSGRVSSHRGLSLIPKASSTMIFETDSSSGGSRRNRTNGSNPRACSTMLNESFLSSGSAGSGSGRHKTNSIPRANSTMICEGLSAVLPPATCGADPTISVIRQSSRASIVSDYDCESVYTWSIHDGDSGSDRDISLEESYMKKVTQSARKPANKPPLPPSKRARSGSVSSKESDFERVCVDHKLHKLLGEPCSRQMMELESVSAIASNDTCRDGALFINSMYDEDNDNDDECIVKKTNTIPRSSTRIQLVDKSSGSSSLEARRASLPDLTTVGTSVCNADSVRDSLSSYSENEVTSMTERPECQGKSSSSTDNPSTGTSLEPQCQLSQGSANIDSILTDSPNSVSSSGINAPYNSPGTNRSSSSRVSCSTTSDAKSSDSNANKCAPRVNILPRNIPLTESPKVQNNVDTGAENVVFKMPRQNQPLKSLFRFRRPKSKTPDMKTSTPKTAPAASDRQSKRQLFPSAGMVNLQQEVKVMDKKAVIKKFRKFSDNFGKRDKSGKPKFETLANL